MRWQTDKNKIISVIRVNIFWLCYSLVEDINLVLLRNKFRYLRQARRKHQPERI